MRAVVQETDLNHMVPDERANDREVHLHHKTSTIADPDIPAGLYHLDIRSDGLARDSERIRSPSEVASPGLSLSDPSAIHDCPKKPNVCGRASAASTHDPGSCVEQFFQT